MESNKDEIMKFPDDEQLERSIQKLAKVQEETGKQVKGYSVSPKSNLTQTQIADELAERVQDYSDYKKGLPTKAIYTEIFIPHEIKKE